MSQKQPSERQSPSSSDNSRASAIPSTAGYPIAESKDSLPRLVLKTKDDNDCAFHAVLGVWNEKEQRIICAEAKQRRAEVARAIEESKTGSRIRPLAVAGIRELIMTGRAVGEANRRLLAAHQGFLADQDALSPQLWQAFEIELREYPQVVDHIAGLNHDPKGTAASLREQFYDALNRNDGELYAIIRSLTDLDAAFKHYNELAQTTYDWEGAVSSEVIAEYAQFVGRPGQWLLPSEVVILAEVFHITVEYYSAPGAQVEIINPDQQRRVVVQFNGRDHFEQVCSTPKSEPKDSKNTVANLVNKQDNKKAIEQLDNTLNELDSWLSAVELEDTQVKKDILSRVTIVKKACEKLKEYAAKDTNPKLVEQSLKHIQAHINSINRRFKDSEKSLEDKTALSVLCDQITAIVKTIYQAYFPEKDLVVTPQARQILLQHAQRLHQSQQTVEQKPSFKALLTGIKDRSLDTENPYTPPSVYFCYAWPHDKFKQDEAWVQPFLKQVKACLEFAGIEETHLDIRDNEHGHNIYHFMDKVGESDYVLVFGTESLLEKHNRGTSALTTELIKLIQKRSREGHKGLHHMLPILLSGNNELSFPSYYTMYTTIRDWTRKPFDENIKLLIETLYKVGKKDLSFHTLWEEYERVRIATTPPENKTSLEIKEQKRGVGSDKDPLVISRSSSYVSSEDISYTSPPTNTILLAELAKKALPQEKKLSLASAETPPNADPLPSATDAKTLSTPRRFVIGNSDFKAVSEQEGLTVDKSLLIKDILEDKTQVKLIIRPRRFGKTSNLSMLYYFFEKSHKNQEKLFQSLNIWQVDNGHYRQYQGKYSVIFLTFKDIKEDTFDDMLVEFYKLMAYTYKKHGLELEVKRNRDDKPDKSALASSLQQLIEQVAETRQSKIILLIDEYDTPINSAYTHDYYTQAAKFIRKFLGSALKDNPHLHWALLTGILRVSRESIFSGLNNLRIYSALDDGFSSYFGFSREEVQALLHKSYGPKVDGSLLDDLDTWYGGYQIGQKRLFNPWSVVNFIEDNWQRQLEGEVLFKSHWINSAENGLVKTLLEKSDSQENNLVQVLLGKAGTSVKEEFKQLMENKPITKTVNEHIVFNDIGKEADTLWSFLLLSGYLTTYPNPVVKSGGPSKYQFVIPNQEIHNFYEAQLKTWLIEEVKETKNQLPDPRWQSQNQRSGRPGVLSDRSFPLEIKANPNKLSIAAALPLVRKGNLEIPKLQEILKELEQQDSIDQTGIEILQAVLGKTVQYLDAQLMAMKVLEKFVKKGNPMAIRIAVDELNKEPSYSRMRRRAASILGNIPTFNEVIFDMLKAALMDTELEVCLTAIRSLARFAHRFKDAHGKAAKNTVLEILTSPTHSPEFRAVAASALGEEGPVNDEDVIQTLTQLQEEPTGKVQSAVKIALKVLRDRSLPRGENLREGLCEQTFSEQNTSIVKPISPSLGSPPASISSTSHGRFFSPVTEKDYDIKDQSQKRNPLPENSLLGEVSQLIDSVYPLNDQASRDVRKTYIRQLAKYRKPDFVMTAKDQADLEELRTRLLKQQPREKGFNCVIS